MSGQVLHRSAGCSLVPSPWSAQGTKTARNGSDLMTVMSSRSPVLCIPDQGCSIAHHETQGTEVLRELSALAGEVGRPRGACEGARGHRRSSPGATRRGEEGFLDLVQATVLRHRQAPKPAPPEG